MVGVVGTSSGYYAIFAIMILGASAIFRLAQTGEWRPFWSAGVVVLGIGVALLASLAPELVYRYRNGPNGATVRSAWESLFYGLYPTLLFTPQTNHRIKAPG